MPKRPGGQAASDHLDLQPHLRQQEKIERRRKDPSCIRLEEQKRVVAEAIERRTAEAAELEGRAEKPACWISRRWTSS